MRYLPRERWGEHPILSRLGYKSDFDGDGTLHLKDYNPAERGVCSSIILEVSEDGGTTWKSSPFADDITYIDSIGAGWYWLASHHPYERFMPGTSGNANPIWRAVLSE